MPFELILFVAPGTTGQARRDDGSTYGSHPAVYDDGSASGRPGIGFTFPDITPNGNGVGITLSSAPGITLRGILWLRVPEFIYPWVRTETAAWQLDDLTPLVVPAVPAPPVNTQDPNRIPLDIIKAIEATGQYDLTTKEGCGRFTEDCCTHLHVLHSVNWGHVRKVGQQNQFNGHAVDAIMLKEPTQNTPAAIYDIIVNSEAPGAHAALNVSSPANPAIWYYPA